MSKSPKPVLAWHWAKALRTQYSNEPIVAGQTLTATGPLSLCNNGMHASLCPLDALQYAPGAMLCRVELSGDVLTGNDKLCARSRKVLWIANADHMLHEFACLCAERALKRAKVEDARSWRAIEVKRLWLAGKATDAELAAASAAASAAAYAAASAAASAAAYAAAWDAASAAASAAARDAAWDAASAAARDASYAASYAAARDAEKAWQREILTALIQQLPMPPLVACPSIRHPAGDSCRVGEVLTNDPIFPTITN